MAKLKYDEELLDSMINYVQVEEHIEKLKFAKKKFISKILKCGVLFVAPLVMLKFIDITSPYFLLYGALDATFGIVTTTCALKIIIENIQKPLCLDELDSNIKHIDDARSYICLKKEGTLTIDPEEFYTNDYYIRKNSCDSNIKLFQSENELQLSKNDAIEQISENIKNYYYNYELPVIKATQKELNQFYEAAYEVFEYQQKEKFFYEYMSSVCGYAISKNLVNNRKIIEMEDFLNALNYLKYCGLKEKDISKIREKIRKEEKIIEFNSYQKKYSKKSS